MEATAWRLDQKSCGGGVEVVGFQREGRTWVAFGWCLAFGVWVEDDDDDDGFGMNPDGDGRPSLSRHRCR